MDALSGHERPNVRRADQCRLPPAADVPVQLLLRQVVFDQEVREIV